MSDYEIVFARSARKELENLDKPLQVRILSKIEELARHPRPSGCAKLVGGNRLWRIRTGDYRVVYDINDSDHQIDVVVIRHRKDVYR